jgi:hypothetical protein
MVSSNQQEILQLSIKQLHLSDDFKQMAKHNNFNSLSEILEIPVSTLIQKAGFTYHGYDELIGFLKEMDSLHLLKLD